MSNTDAEIQRFYNFLQIKPLSTAQIALWQALHYIYTQCKKEWFSAANQTLELLTGSSRQAIYENRNILKQNGLIDFKSNGTKATSYTMLNSLQDSLQDTLQITCQDTIQDTLQKSRTLYKLNYKLNYIKLKELFNYINGKADFFQGIFEKDRIAIVNTLKRLGIYWGNIDDLKFETIFDQERQKHFIIMYWCIKELYFSSFRVYMNDIDEKFFQNKFLKTLEMLDITEIDINNDDDITEIVSYFIKTLKREYEKQK